VLELKPVRVLEGRTVTVWVAPAPPWLSCWDEPDEDGVLSTAEEMDDEVIVPLDWAIEVVVESVFVVLDDDVVVVETTEVVRVGRTGTVVVV
jgi:hypothetical protein